MRDNKKAETANPKDLGRILIVSKDVGALRKARGLLAAEGYAIVTAITLEEARQLCGKSLPSLCIIDFDFLPEVDEAVLKRLIGFFVAQDRN